MKYILLASGIGNIGLGIYNIVLGSLTWASFNFVITYLCFYSSAKAEEK